MKPLRLLKCLLLIFVTLSVYAKHNIAKSEFGEGTAPGLASKSNCRDIMEKYVEYRSQRYAISSTFESESRISQVEGKAYYNLWEDIKQARQTLSGKPDLKDTLTLTIAQFIQGNSKAHSKSAPFECVRKILEAEREVQNSRVSEKKVKGAFFNGGQTNFSEAPESQKMAR